MLFYGIAAGCEAIAGARRLERGPVPDLVPDRRGVDRWLAGPWYGVPAGSTRFGDSVALCLLLAGLFTFRPQRRNTRARGRSPLLYFIAAVVLALAIAVETYFQNERWPCSPPVLVGGERPQRSCSCHFTILDARVRR